MSERLGATGVGFRSVWGLDLPMFRVGPGAIRTLAALLERLGVTEGPVTIITDATVADLGHVDAIREQLPAAMDISVDAKSTREPSVADLETAVERHSERPTSAYIALGGGSVLDTAKAVRALGANPGRVREYVGKEGSRELTLPGRPLITIPTTLGTPAQLSRVVAVTDSDGHKTSLSGAAVQPNATIADPTLSTSLPPELTAAVAMDAIGPAMESYLTPPVGVLSQKSSNNPVSIPGGRTRITDTLAVRALKLLLDHTRGAVHRGTDLEARDGMMVGSLMASIAGRAAGVHLGHATAYAVQECCGTYHSESVGVMIPAAVLEYASRAEPARGRRIAELIGVSTDGLSDAEAITAGKREFLQFQEDLGVFPTGLAELAGIDGTESELEALATQTLTHTKLLRFQPRQTSTADLIEIFRDALGNQS